MRSEDEDADLWHQLRRVVGPDDPVPPSVVAAAYGALASRRDAPAEDRPAAGADDRDADDAGADDRDADDAGADDRDAADARVPAYAPAQRRR